MLSLLRQARARILLQLVLNRLRSRHGEVLVHAPRPEYPVRVDFGDPAVSNVTSNIKYVEKEDDDGTPRSDQG